MNTITYRYDAESAGKTRATAAGAVEYVADERNADIVFRKYTADYSTTADKKFMVTATRRRYATLEAAAAAVVKARSLALAA